MSLLFKFNRETYHPDNRLDMYDLLVRLTDAEERISQLEAHRDLFHRLWLQSRLYRLSVAL